MQGLTDKQQAVIVLVSVGLIALGATATQLPNAIGQDAKDIITYVFIVLGTIGLAFKELLGTLQSNPAQTPQNQVNDKKTL